MNLAGWTPVYSYFASGQLMLDWCYTGQRRFTEPFFGDTVDVITRDPAALLFRHQTTMEEAAGWNSQHPGLSPSGFIFHMSRCGSTLTARMLAALPAHRVLSEPTPLNAVIRAALLDTAVPRATLLHWLRTLVSLLGCPLPGENRYFIKLECWHVLALPLIVEAFPAAPWIFLYRNPAEVLVSQARIPGAWTVPGALDPEIFGVPQEDVFALPRQEYVARALSRICEAALEHRHCGRGRLVNYSELPEFICSQLPGQFGLALSPADLDRMRSASSADAKTPQLPYADDRQSKRSSVTPAIQVLVDRWLRSPFAGLEKVSAQS